MKLSSAISETEDSRCRPHNREREVICRACQPPAIMCIQCYFAHLSNQHCQQTSAIHVSHEIGVHVEKLQKKLRSWADERQEITQCAERLRAECARLRSAESKFKSRLRTVEELVNGWKRGIAKCELQARKTEEEMARKMGGVAAQKEAEVWQAKNAIKGINQLMKDRKFFEAYMVSAGLAEDGNQRIGFLSGEAEKLLQTFEKRKCGLLAEYEGISRCMRGVQETDQSETDSMASLVISRAIEQDESGAAAEIQRLEAENQELRLKLEMFQGESQPEEDARKEGEFHVRALPQVDFAESIIVSSRNQLPSTAERSTFFRRTPDGRHTHAESAFVSSASSRQNKELEIDTETTLSPPQMTAGDPDGVSAQYRPGVRSGATHERKMSVSSAMSLRTPPQRSAVMTKGGDRDLLVARVRVLEPQLRERERLGGRRHEECVGKVTDKMHSIEKEMRELRESLGGFQGEIAEKNEELMEKDERVREFEEKVRRLEEVNRGMQEGLATLENELKEKEGSGAAEILRMKEDVKRQEEEQEAKLREIEQRNQALGEKNSELNETVRKLQARVRELTSELERKQKTIEDSEKVAADIKAKLSSHEAELLSHKARLAKTLYDSKALEEAQRSLQAQTATLSETEAKAARLEKQLSDAKVMLSALQGKELENRQWRERIEQLEQGLRAVKAEIQVKNSQLEKKGSTIAELEAKFERVVSENSGLRQQVQDKCEELNARKKSVDERTEELEKQIRSKEAELNSAVAKAKEFEAAGSMIRKMLQDCLQSSPGTGQSLEDTVKELRQTFDSQRQSLREKQAKVQQLEKSEAECRGTVQTLRLQAADRDRDLEAARERVRTVEIEGKEGLLTIAGQLRSRLFGGLAQRIAEWEKAESVTILRLSARLGAAKVQLLDRTRVQARNETTLRFSLDALAQRNKLLELALRLLGRKVRSMVLPQLESVKKAWLALREQAIGKQLAEMSASVCAKLEEADAEEERLSDEVESLTDVVKGKSAKITKLEEEKERLTKMTEEEIKRCREENRETKDKIQQLMKDIDDLRNRDAIMAAKYREEMMREVDPPYISQYYPSNKGGNHVRLFNAKVRKFVDLTFNNPHPEKWATSIIVKDEMYIIGGCEPPTSTVYAVSLVGVESGATELKTAKKFDLNIPRGCIGLTTCRHKYIYALGGYDGIKSEKCCEKFDLGRNVWIVLPSLSEPKYNLACCELGKFVYSIGGYNGKDFLTTVERISILRGEDDGWVVISLPPGSGWTPRNCCGAYGIRPGEILVFGGYNGADISECYVMNEVQGKSIMEVRGIAKIQDADTFHFNKNCAMLDGRLFVLSRNERLHVFDTKDMAWKLSAE